MEEIKMKDSGIKWIGKIPEDWDIKKVKYKAKLYTGNSIADNEKENYEDSDFALPYIATKDINVHNHNIDYENGMYIKKDDWSFKRAPKDSSLLCIEGGSAGKKIGYTNQPVCFVNKLCCFTSDNMDNKFLFYTLNSYSFKEAFNQNIFGLIGGVSTEKIKNIKITIPSVEEQKLIAGFLDKKCADIDEIISKTEKQIETLEQYKKSLITETIITGNNPNAKLIKTNIKWIDKVSTEATILRLKNYSYMKGRIGWQGLTADEFIDEGPYCVTGTDFKNGYIDWNTSYHISEKRYQMDYNIQLKVGDLLVTKDGTIGKLARVNYLPDKACLNSHLLIIRPLRNKFINDYLYYVMSSDIFVKYYSFESNGSTMDSLSQEKLGRFTFPAYSIEKQKEIANYLDKKCADIDEVLNKQKESLETLKKYKQSLIYEYVTGKKRV